MEEAFPRKMLVGLIQNLFTFKAKVHSYEAERAIDELIACVEAYLTDERQTQPHVLKRMPQLVESLSEIHAEDTVEICELLVNNCRRCMLHIDSCFINVLFMVFKSIQLRRVLEPIKSRPSLRTEK
jgi:hypothetical protein